MPDQAFAGIDVAFAKRKTLPLCVACWIGNQLTPLDLRSDGVPPIPRGSGNRASLDPSAVVAFAEQTVAVLDALSDAHGVTISRVAIDAPSSPCPAGLARRRAERALDALGFSCIPTPTEARFLEVRSKCSAHVASGGTDARLPHANQLWMLVGFALFSTVGRSRTVLEVYPHAIVRSLGVTGRHKSTPEGYTQQVAAAAQATGWSDPTRLEAALRRSVPGTRHDRLDAFLSAWIAALPPDDLEAYGAPPDDVIWVPHNRAVEAAQHRFAMDEALADAGDLAAETVIR